MTVTIAEIKESRTVFKNDDGVIEGLREFIVAGDSSTTVTTAAQAIAELAAADPAVIEIPPRELERHPEDPRLIARTWQIDPMPDRGADGAWIIRWFYRTATIIGGTGEESLRINVKLENQFIDKWRVWTYDSINFGGPDGNGEFPLLSVTNPARANIGGIQVDSAGEPISSLVPVLRVDVSLKMSPPINLALWSQQVGGRNSNSVLLSGFLLGRGKALYIGTDVNQITDDELDVVHSFVVDRDFHLRQMAQRDVDGKVITEEVGANDRSVAKIVYWVQPFPNTFDFLRLF